MVRLGGSIRSHCHARTRRVLHHWPADRVEVRSFFSVPEYDLDAQRSLGRSLGFAYGRPQGADGSPPPAAWAGSIATGTDTILPAPPGGKPRL